jgi:hypothetical protein
MGKLVAALIEFPVGKFLTFENESRPFGKFAGLEGQKLPDIHQKPPRLFLKITKETMRLSRSLNHLPTPSFFVAMTARRGER